MVRLLQEHKADVLSVVIPIKNEKGLTSTALDVGIGDEDSHWRVKRLTLTEIYNDYEPTFTHEKLLVNTGLMLVDLRKPWVENVWFAFEDKIIPDPKVPGNFKAVGVSEDWFFSRRARELGAKLYATREISVLHSGTNEFSNASAWGSLGEDAPNE
jgi:GT2 family glycosyltransferase